MSRTLATLLLFVSAAGCQAETPGSRKPDASTETPTLRAPVITDIPAATPLASVAVRGNTVGSKLIVQGADGGEVVGVPLPSGDFCINVPVAGGTTSTLKFIALGNGLLSPATEKVVVQDPGAAQPANPYCGDGPDVCVDDEDCTEGTLDEDCDGWQNLCDLDCSGCDDDIYAPNHYPRSVPSLPRGTYSFVICPCHDDWFSFYLEAGDIFRADASFVATDIDIDIRLYEAAQAESANYTTYVASSAGVQSPEHIEWTATATGTYYLRVYSFVPEKSDDYTLTVTYY